MRRSSERTVLICEKCGEKLVIVCPEDVWRSERTVFECACGEKHTLPSRRRRNSTTGNHTTSELPTLNPHLPGRRSA